MENKERTQNGFYIAVSVLLFISIGVMTIMLFLSIYAIAMARTLSENISRENGMTNIVTVEDIQVPMIFLLIYSLFSIGFNIFLAIFYLKHSKMTAEEAANSYNACLVWTIISFFTSGLLVGGLALGGLLSVQKKQKDKFALSQPTQEMAKDEEIDRLQSELTKLNNMKNAGIITEEEYSEMRKKIINDFSAK